MTEWIARGWGGQKDVVDAFKQLLEAQIGGDAIGQIVPAVGHLPGMMEGSGALWGFVVAARADYAIGVPEGLYEMLPAVASSLNSTLAGAPR